MREINISHNGHEYTATLEGYDGAPDSKGIYSLIGHGETAEDAKEDLSAQIDDCTEVTPNPR